eukprot:CAMPEP_0184496040 /NCGR_PEP_ID=MMETSP0113_2-20130426/32994_1 /TAXON_ID=91329 /ORGANISM="Norrisiella sphaerica, Strain BC52" /LENGTH=194 /DNA_ID=CAMNT_0026882519 /DNA_START=33 /DNA_END=617 /DNA_ORIENTATION=-
MEMGGERCRYEALEAPLESHNVYVSVVPRKKFFRRQLAISIFFCAAIVGMVMFATLLVLKGTTEKQNLAPPLRQEAEKPKKRKKVSAHEKAGLSFPVGRIARNLKRGNYADRVSKSAAVMLAAVTEYLTAEVLELAGNAAAVARKTRIIPRHIFLGIKTDEELSKYMDEVIFHQGGVLPQNVPPPKPKKKKAEE